MCNNHTAKVLFSKTQSGKKLTKYFLIPGSLGKIKWLSQLWRFGSVTDQVFTENKLRSAPFLTYEPWKQEVRTGAGKEKHNRRYESWSLAHCPMGSLEMKLALQIPYFLSKVKGQKAWNWKCLPMEPGVEVRVIGVGISASFSHYYVTK